MKQMKVVFWNVKTIYNPGQNDIYAASRGIGKVSEDEEKLGEDRQKQTGARGGDERVGRRLAKWHNNYLPRQPRVESQPLLPLVLL